MEICSYGEYDVENTGNVNALYHRIKQLKYFVKVDDF